MRVSIALCVFNGEAFLEQQLASILAQTRLPDEVICCDDVSMDRSWEILSAFRDKAPFTVTAVKNDSNLGFVKNFEQAISLCRGDVVFLCDQDDEWRTEKIERLLAAFAANLEAEAIFSDARVVNAAGQSQSYSLFAANQFTFADRIAFRSMGAHRVLARKAVVTGATLAIRRQLKDLALPFPVEFEHDRWLSLLAACRGRLGYVSEQLIDYRVHSSNQIGVEAPSVTSKLTRAMATTADDLERRALQIDTLLGFEGLGFGEAASASMRDAATFLRFRSRLQPQMTRRLLPILGNILNGRYFLYGNGLRSVAKDLLLTRPSKI